MIDRRRLTAGTAMVLVSLLIAATALLVRQTWFRPTIITAYFAAATAIYPGDDVRVSGVKVGTIAAIDPDGTEAKVTLRVTRDVPIPADAKAVIVAQNLVAARYVQLAPAYESAGPTMPDGAVIPVDRTAVPVEWDEVKEQLTRLATELGPTGNVSAPAVSRFINSAANALDGNGDKLRTALAQLAGAGRILTSSGTNIVDIIKNLTTFVTALRDSKEQIVQFQNGLATLTSVLDGSRSDLDSALTNLSEAIVDVHRFLRGTRDTASEQIRQLVDVTQNLVEHRLDVEQVLHLAPTSLTNVYNMFDPRTGAAAGEFIINNLSDPVGLICTMTGAIGNITAPETGKLCAQYLGPGLRTLSVNYLPFPVSPILTAVPPWQDLVYSEARLQPGGEGPKAGPPETPPAVSAYTGMPGDSPGAAPDPSAAPAASPAADPSPPTHRAGPAETPAPTSLPGMLLPSEEPPS